MLEPFWQHKSGNISTVVLPTTGIDKQASQGFHHRAEQKQHLLPDAGVGESSVSHWVGAIIACKRDGLSCKSAFLHFTDSFRNM